MYEKVSVKRLTKGLYISLRDIPWFKHPFLISNFEITKQSQIRDIQSTGYETVLYDPERSASKPLTQDRDDQTCAQTTDFISKESIKSKKASELRNRRQRFHQMEQNFTEALDRTAAIVDGVKSKQIGFYEEIKSVAHDMADIFIDEVNLSVQHINASAANAGQHYHSLNVMVLSMMLGKEFSLEREAMEHLGFGALVHDIGQIDFPQNMRDDPKRKKIEAAEYRKHSKIGVGILSQLPDINPDVMKIVYQHHEQSDGNGFPKGIKDDKISYMAKIVAVADLYDRLINTRDPLKALSPHKALAYLYGKKKHCFDESCLGTFIKMLGVYPAGTVCRFTSGDVGIILSVDPNDPLHPEFIIYDPAIPKHDALIYKLGIDLDLTIDTTLNMAELDTAEMTYLDSRASIQYFPSQKG